MKLSPCHKHNNEKKKGHKSSNMVPNSLTKTNQTNCFDHYEGKYDNHFCPCMYAMACSRDRISITRIPKHRRLLESIISQKSTRAHGTTIKNK